MLLNRGMKVRIYPNKTQLNKINTTLHHCRYVYNEMLARNKKVYERRGEHLYYNAMQNLLPVMKQYKSWLKEADSQALNYACRQLDTAYTKFFKKQAGFPNFHKKRGRQGYTTTNMSCVKFDKNKVKMPCLGWVKARGLRPLPDGAKLCNIAISKDPDGKYYASINYKYEMPDPQVETPTRFIGLDYKSNGLYTDSFGYTAAMPKWFRESQAKLSKAQRKLSRRVGSRKGEHKSNSYRKQLEKVSRIHKKIANQRMDYLHKESKRLADMYDIIGIEDLNMTDMSHSLPWTTYRRATYDNGFGMFVQMLEYKLQERGKRLIKVDKDYPSTETCSCCGSRQPMPLSVRIYRCPNCGFVLDRDYNAAINILRETKRFAAA